MRLMQIYALMVPKHVDAPENFIIVSNENEVLMDKYSIGKLLLPTDTLPETAYLPSQDDIIQFYATLKKENIDPWEFLINTLSVLSYSILADPKNVFSLNEIYVPCED